MAGWQEKREQGKDQVKVKGRKQEVLSNLFMLTSPVLLFIDLLFYFLLQFSETVYILVYPKSRTMRTTKLSVSFTLLLSAFFFTNCTRDTQVNYTENTSEIITQGKWSVEYFFANQDLTAQYNNYQFTFLGNGTLTATNNTMQVHGNWRMIKDVDRKDILQINIITGDPNLVEMNEHWNVTDKTLLKLAMVEGNNQLRLRKL